MEYGAIVVLTGLCLILQCGAQPTSHKISGCENGRVDIVENQINSITCEGDFDTDDELRWNIEKGGVGQNVANCKCSPAKQCIASDTLGAEWMCGSKVFQLFIEGNASVHENSLICERVYQQGQQTTRTSCTLNVIAKETTTHTHGTVEAIETTTHTHGTVEAKETTTHTHGTVEVNAITTSSHRTSNGSAATRNSDQRSDSNDFPLEPVVGGAVAAFVVIVVIVIVVVIVLVKRRRTKENTGARHSAEPHVYYNTQNGTEVAVGHSQNAYSNTSTGSPEFGIYASADDEGSFAIPNNTPDPIQDGFGTYDAPPADVYAQVDKSKKKRNKQASSNNPTIPHTVAGIDEYAVVNKASRAKQAANPSGDYLEGNESSAVPVTDVYAQVDKTAKRTKTDVSALKTQPEEEGGVTYA